MNYPLWLKRSPTELRLEIKVKPGAKQNTININAETCLQISLQASAQEGKANKLLIQYLSKFLKIPQKQITILRGMTSRTKVIGIEVLEEEQERIIRLLQIA